MRATGSGILRRLRTTPVQPATLLAAQMIMMLGVTVISTAMVLVVVRIAFGTALPANPAAFVLALLLASAALYALGLVVASGASTGRAASAIGTALFFPLMFFGGLWLPRDVMPEQLRQIGAATPVGAAVQALQDSLAGYWPQPVQVGVLIGWALLAAVVAGRMFRWE